MTNTEATTSEVIVHRSVYLVEILNDGKWEAWGEYHTLDRALVEMDWITYQTHRSARYSETWTVER
jgi:hypothetical protein